MPGFIKAVLLAEAILAVLVTALSLVFYFHTPSPKTPDELAVAKAIFDLAVLQGLMGLFKTAIAAALTWIFGKPVIGALVYRLTR